ncbi:hypothetical protein GN958_ATG15137 [Phytophthora infestans]|uniref:Uncharacterized protein n=1 Tax=Phytophthora infestans TaxID=4787 RepID=A0A8S9U3L2_PHYIN|nr:hypothetical protein GN958_ATG15137 [Phytophthora infestans]
MELVRDGLQAPLSAVATSSSSSWQRPVLPEASQAPPDVMLHVGGCIFALHEEVLRLRWPWLHLQLQRFREHKNGSYTAIFSRYTLQLASSDPSKEHKEATKRCPFQTITLSKPLLYTRCFAAAHQRMNVDAEYSSSSDDEQLVQDNEMDGTGKKRRRKETVHRNNNWHTRWLHTKRPKSLFDSDMEIPDTSNTRVTSNVLHVELVGASAIAMVPVIEYVYTFKVRLLHNSSARETLLLSEWVGMGDRLRYCCLKAAVRQVTLDTWMELLVSSAALSKKEMRNNLSERLIDFLYGLQPVQYQDAMDKIQTTWIQAINDHDIVVRAVFALIKNVRLVGFWRNLLDALTTWLKRRFDSPQLPSLRTIHQHFAKDWEPYVELSRVECFTNTPTAVPVPLHVALFEFGDFVLQAGF